MFGLLEKVEKAILKWWEKNEHFTADFTASMHSMVTQHL